MDGYAGAFILTEEVIGAAEAITEVTDMATEGAIIVGVMQVTEPVIMPADATLVIMSIIIETRGLSRPAIEPPRIT
jgi:hypothetical protein